MQTRRDQLHAYRFLTKRALAALVTGQPNAVEPPLRRLTVTTISGIMVAVLVGVGFALVGFLKPSAGDAWKDGKSIIVENDTGARYVYLQGKLDPVVNYTSAVLAIGGGSSTDAVGVTHVDADDIDGTPVGPTIGIPNLPDSLPSSGNALDGPYIGCSRLVLDPDDAAQINARVSLRVGDTDLRTRPLPEDVGVLVQARSSDTRYLLYQGHRLEIGSDEISVVVGAQDVQTLTVGTGFLNALPPGPDLTTPTIAGLGGAGPMVGDTPTRVGQIVFAQDAKRSFLALASGLAPLTPFQAALVGTVTDADGSHLPQVVTDQGSAFDAKQVDLPAALHDAYDDLPPDIPDLDPDPAANGGVCASFNGPDSARLLLPGRTGAAATSSPTIAESALSQRGEADEVTVEPGHVALAQIAGSNTTFLITPSGAKYPFTDATLKTALGYASVQPTSVAPSVLHLLPTGPALDPVAARRTTS